MDERFPSFGQSQQTVEDANFWKCARGEGTLAFRFGFLLGSIARGPRLWWRDVSVRFARGFDFGGRL